MKIALVPNDDGYGPSALGYYVAKALLARHHSIVVVNENAQKLNSAFYEDEIKAGTVVLHRVFGGVRLRKTAEGVDIAGSLRDLRDYYPCDSDKYVIPGDVDAVVDIGTPPATRAARRAGKPAFTLFDHSWGRTYEMLLANCIRSFAVTSGGSPAADLITQAVGVSQVRSAIDRLRDDESKATRVFLFPCFMAPQTYHQHWASLGVQLSSIPGVLGVPTVGRAEARARMGITEIDAPDTTVYVLGGGTPIWDEKLPQIVSQLKDRDLRFNVVIFDRGARADSYRRVGERVYQGGPITGKTVQGILPGVDLIVTRAGGGIVNDAIACRVPLVCVEEPNHEQVEMIRQNCVREGLTRTVEIDEFRTGDVGAIIEREIGNEEGNEQIRRAMSRVPNGCEIAIAERIAEWCEANH